MIMTTNIFVLSPFAREMNYIRAPVGWGMGGGGDGGTGNKVAIKRKKKLGGRCVMVYAVCKLV